MCESPEVKLFNLEPQYSLSGKSKDVSLVLDHMEDGFEGVSLEELYAKETYTLGENVTISIRNSVTPKERELFQFFKLQIKKKNFEAIATRASEVLQNNPSSLWAHSIFGTACNKIPGKEKYVVPAFAAAVSINPNFLTGWQVLHKQLSGLGGFFSRESHDQMCLVVKVLLRLDPNYDSWCTIMGQIWHYLTSNDFNQNRILSLVSPILSCSCPRRRYVAANVFINFIREKRKLLPREFSNQVLLSFQVLISQKRSEICQLGLLYAALRYFNRTKDTRQICRLLNYIHVNDVLDWNLKSGKEFAYHLIYEIFKSLGEEAIETVVILRNACGQDILENKHYVLSSSVFKLTDSYSSLLENYNPKPGTFQTWGRVLYLKVLIQLKLYQEAYEQILVDLHCGVEKAITEKAYMGMLIDIFSHSKDPALHRFTLKLGFKYLKMYGLDVKVLHCLCLACISMKDNETAKAMSRSLVSLGALDDVIYVQALLEQDEDIKLDYLKSLENIPDAYLLSATIYKGMGKPKRVLKSMLEASFHYHGGILPFEWLGIYYYERDVPLKATRYFLEAFSHYLISSVSVNYIISLYTQEGDVEKARAFFEILNSRNAISTDVMCTANLRAGLNYLTKAKETLDFHRAVEKFRKVTDFSFERTTIEMVADSLGYFGMHGSAADFYLMCHAEYDVFHVYPSVLYGAETKMIKGKGHRYMSIVRNVAKKAGKSPLALFTYGCALLDKAVASYAVSNYHHCVFLCQQAILVLSRCTALYSKFAVFWLSLGNALFTVSSLHSDLGAVYVPSWLAARKGETQTMVLVKKHEAFIIALRCYAIALEICTSEEIRKLTSFYIGIMFRYAKTFYKEIGDRMLCWALDYALRSCDLQSWQRNNLCGVILTGLDKYWDALEFFKDAITIGSREDVRDAEFNLGLVYLRLGEFNNAHEVFMHRRGNDTMDSLVWRSYMLLHRCLEDRATVLHYLWHLIYCIRHNPSLEQGMEYLQLICDSGSITNPDLDHINKKCLLYAILKSPMFMKMTFVGDCEVSHKFNDVTASNYFYHGKFHAMLAHHPAAEGNFHEFLKLVAENNGTQQPLVDPSFFTLATSPNNSLDALLVTSKASTKVDLAKLCCCLESTIKDLPQFGPDCDRTLEELLDVSKLTVSQLPDAVRKQLTNFLSRALMRQLLGVPTSGGKLSPPPCCEDTLDKIIFDLGKFEETSCFLGSDCINALLEEQLNKFKIN